jgi:4a-hydroxytetrahydrobiopterin dehydratase
MPKLDDAGIEAALRGLPGWAREGQAIRKTYRFPDFKGSMAFVVKVALHAEAMDHHPDILVSYAQVTLTLWSHDAGGLTERDVALARRIDG